MQAKNFLGGQTSCKIYCRNTQISNLNRLSDTCPILLMPAIYHAWTTTKKMWKCEKMRNGNNVWNMFRHIHLVCELVFLHFVFRLQFPYCQLYTMHESRQIWCKSAIMCVYTQVIRVRFVRDLIRDSRFANSQPLPVFAQTIKGHELDFHQFVCDTFISIHCSCILEDLFCKFLNSSRLINYQLINLWLFAMVRRWVCKSWIWRIHE